MKAGLYRVVMVCNCSTPHAPMYVTNGMTRVEAKRAAAKFALENGHGFSVVYSNGLDEPRDMTSELAQFAKENARQ